MGAGTSTPQLIFGSRDGDFLAITPRRRPYADPRNLSDDAYDWDANWVECLVEAKLRGFRAKFDASFMTTDFPPFRDALGTLWNTLRGEAAFTRGAGHAPRTRGWSRARVRTGELQDLAGVGNRLVFERKLDQTYLGSTLRQLDDLIERFPVLSRPRGPG